MLVSTAAAAVVLHVAAASDLEFIMPKLIQLYGVDHSAAKIEVTYGPSGSLATQLEAGAPFDLFFSADGAYADQLVAKGFASAVDEHPYAKGELVLWVRADSRLDLGKLGMNALLDPSVKRIAIANPRHAPYGKAAETALRNSGLYDRLVSRLTLGESVAQTAQFVATGAAEIGLIAASLSAPGTPLAKSGRFWGVPENLYPALEQRAVVLKRGTDPVLSRDFMDFVLHQDKLWHDSGYAVSGQKD